MDVKTKTDLNSLQVGDSFCKVAVPLTDGQQEILLSAVMGDDANCAFNLLNCLHLSGDINSDALKRAIQQVVDRFDALRATISEDGRCMRIAPSSPSRSLCSIARERVNPLGFSSYDPILYLLV